jgi:hypothetical protein
MLLGAVAILLWHGTAASVALAEVLARMDDIGAYTCETTVSLVNPDRQMKATTWISNQYGTRTVVQDANSGEVSTEVYVLPKERKAVLIEHDKKAYMQFSFDEQWNAVMQKEIPDPRAMLVGIQKCDYTSLGISTIDGVEAEGFRTRDPNYVPGGANRVDVSVWVDVKTGLPVRSEENIESEDGTALHRVSHDFQWDVPIDPAMFQPLIPDGYANASGGSLQVPAFNEETAIRGLRLCAELGGQYPSDLSDPCLNAHTNRLPEVQGMTDEQIRAYVQDPNHRAQIIQKTMPLMALRVFHGLLVEQNREPMYYGRTVTPETPDAVLWRWKLDDGRYRVIFGDLSAKHVSAEELAVLEAVPSNQEPRAVSPQPADGAIGCSPTGTRLQWTPGLGATEHRVYFGQDPDSLTVTATVSEPHYSQLPTLVREASYYWRVDEVQADGTITRGPVWRFDTGRLVAHWRFDEKTGKQVTDASGHGHTGQVRGNPKWTDGIAGSALLLDGKGDYVQIGMSPEFSMTGQITVAAWFKIASFDKESQAIVTKGDRAWRLQKNRGTHSLLFACSGLKTADEWGATRGHTKVDDNRWHHAVGVYDGTRIALYIDGKLDASARASGPIATNDEPVLIGENSERPDRFWHGLIDEVRIYSYALSENEIVALDQETLTNATTKVP